VILLPVLLRSAGMQALRSEDERVPIVALASNAAPQKITIRSLAQARPSA
jgi:hypothetical protein